MRINSLITKHFGQPLLFSSYKLTLNHKTTLTDKEEINKSDDDSRGVFRILSNIRVLQCIVNFRNHQSILAIF